MSEPVKPNSQVAPGRDLDKLAAEVMGYADFWQDRRTGLWYGYHPDHTNLEDDRIPIPQFSTDGYAAWEAWEWLEKNTLHYSLCLTRAWNDEPAVFIMNGGVVDTLLAKGESYPHAIALAVVAKKEAGL